MVAGFTTHEISSSPPEFISVTFGTNKSFWELRLIQMIAVLFFGTESLFKLDQACWKVITKHI
jgi:hypothetical protein